MALRDGKKTLSQLINAIESEKTGNQYQETFDDIKDSLVPGAFKKADKNITRAFQDYALDNSLCKQAVKRGVS